MLIKVNFYKESGKWYAGGVVPVQHQLYQMDELKQDIINNQDILMDGWQNIDNFYVVISLVEADEERAFAERLFKPGAFRGIQKQHAKEATAYVDLEDDLPF